MLNCSHGSHFQAVNNFISHWGIFLTATAARTLRVSPVISFLVNDNNSKFAHLITVGSSWSRRSRSSGETLDRGEGDDAGCST